MFLAKHQLISGAFTLGSFCLQDTSMETNELVDLSDRATKVNKEGISWLTGHPFPWSCRCWFRTVWEEGRTRHSGHAISLTLGHECQGACTHIPVMTFSGFLFLGGLFLLDLCSGTSPAEASLEAQTLLTCGTAGGETPA